MKNTLALSLIVFSQPFSGANDTAPAAVAPSPGVFDTLNVAMQKQVDDQKVSGLIGLVHRDGETVYYETFGKRNIQKDRPMSKDTLFRIYSMTKPLTAVTAMSLWEEGKFKLDDPISKHLPEWKEPTVRKKDGKVVPATVPITPRHLLTHSSGLRYGKDGLDLNESTTLEEFSKSLAKRPLKFEPGTDYQYGYSTDILGRYIEAIEGKPLNVVMRERIFNKLGMDETGFWIRDEMDRDRVAIVYTKKKKNGQLISAMPPDAVMKKPARMMGGQGLMSTTKDYAKFCEMLLNKGALDGKRVLKKETVKLMCENHLKDIGKTYGLGGIVDGKGRYSWGGAAGTRFWVDASTGSYAVFMVQHWGYKPPTFKVFTDHLKTALGREKLGGKPDEGG